MDFSSENFYHWLGTINSLSVVGNLLLISSFYAKNIAFSIYFVRWIFLAHNLIQRSNQSAEDQRTKSIVAKSHVKVPHVTQIGDTNSSLESEESVLIEKETPKRKQSHSVRKVDLCLQKSIRVILLVSCAVLLITWAVTFALYQTDTLSLNMFENIGQDT